MNRNKKIKQQYRNSYKSESFFLKDYYFDIYPNVRSGCHKKFSKQQEKSHFQMHSLEYKREYGLKIRGKRAGGLAECWDDYPSYVCEMGKSWKHNSKRKTQYYKEK